MSSTMISGRIFTSFAKFSGMVSVNHFWFPVGLQELLQALFRFPEKFGFCTEKIESNEWPNLGPRQHTSASSFTVFTENFVICCYQVTQLFWSVYWIASAFSARSLRHPGPHAGVAISVFREESTNTVLARHHFYRRFLMKRFTTDACGSCTWCRSFFVH